MENDFCKRNLFIFIFTAISGFTEEKTKETATVTQTKTASEQKDEYYYRATKRKCSKMDYGRNANMLIYEKYGVKYQSYEPTDIVSSKIKLFLNTLKNGSKHNMSVPEYIEKRMK